MESLPVSLNIVGAGRVGQTLGRLFHDSGVFAVQYVLTRSIASAQRSAQFIGAGLACESLALMPCADVWLLTVPDGQIAATAQALAARGAALRPALALHCSGALGSDQLAPLGQLGWQVASAHPLLSFAKPDTALQQFTGTPCALEGDSAALSLLTTAFSRIGARCFTLQAEHKLLYHAGAVFASNFLPVLLDLAEQLWREGGMPEALVQPLRSTLLHNAVNNIVALGPQAALTGPAARDDVALVAAQGQAVAQWNADAGHAYTALSRLAGLLARRTGAAPPRQ